jgi:hypothetical protein
MSFEKTFGLSTVFIESALMENGGGVPESADPSMLIKEAIHVISCGYEEKTEWGKEVRLKFQCSCNNSNLTQARHIIFHFLINIVSLLIN